MDWYPWFVDDFRRKTLHLSLAEDGAYRRLIDEYMRVRGPLPNDDQSIARMLGVGVSEWLAVEIKVRAFFRVKDGSLYHKRCEQELRAQELRFKTFSKRGQKAAFAKYSKVNKLAASRMLVPTTLYTKKILSSSECGKEGAFETEKSAPHSGSVSPQLAASLRSKGFV